MGLLLPRAPQNLLGAWVLFCACAWLACPVAAANTLVHLKRSVWGCFDPNVAAVINDDRNPGGSDPQWLARTSAEGQCVTITPKSAWEPVSREVNGLTYVSYRGKTARPGSFWVPTAAIDFTPPPEAIAPAPALVIAEPLPSPPAVVPAPTPEPTPAVQATNEPPPQPTEPAPVSPPPQAEAAPPPAPPSQPRSGGGSIIAVLVVLGLFGLVRRSSRQNTGRTGKSAKAGDRKVVTSKARRPGTPASVPRPTPTAGQGDAIARAAVPPPALPVPATDAAETIRSGPFRIHPSSIVHDKRGPPPEPHATLGKAGDDKLVTSKVKRPGTPASVPRPTPTAGQDDAIARAAVPRPSPPVAATDVSQAIRSGPFRIHPSSIVHDKRGPPPEPEATSARWMPPSSAVTIAGHVVADGMIYLGRATGRTGAHDGCFVDPALPVASSSRLAGPLGYWPSYAGLTPPCRRAYLEWLASGKRASDDDIGYVFLYFYGLERRLVVESPATEEARALASEIERLRSIYVGNGSFDRYSRRLLDAAATLHLATAGPGAAFTPDLAAPAGEMPLALKVAIARAVAAGRPLPFEIAAAGLLGLHDFHSKHHLALNAGRSAFLTVLRGRFANAFPNGFKPHNGSGAQLRLVYVGAAAGLTVELAARYGNLPDPTELDWTELVSLAEIAARDVEPHAKMLAHHPERAESLAALVSCPAEIASGIAQDAHGWIDALPSPAGVRFGELALQAIGVGSAKWTVRHHRLVAEALAAVGRGMEPDPEDGSEHLEDATLVQVFRTAHPGIGRSRDFRIASAAAFLVAGIAKAADVGAEAVEAAWLGRVPSRMALRGDESVRLAARLAWLRGSISGLAKAKRLMAGAAWAEREFCAWSATVATGADGAPGKSQVATLEAIYDAFEITRGSLYAGLHAGISAAAPSADDPVSVFEEVATVLHAISRPPAPAASSDGDRLSRIRAETDRVSALLAEVFVEEDAGSDAPPPRVDDGEYPGLDAVHAGLTRRMLSRADWTRTEFEAEARSLGLMPDGAMEAINEWAFDNHGEALIEDGDLLAVNLALLPFGTGLAAAAE